jgi:hypothetical protein
MTGYAAIGDKELFPFFGVCAECRRAGKRGIVALYLQGRKDHDKEAEGKEEKEGRAEESFMVVEKFHLTDCFAGGFKY